MSKIVYLVREGKNDGGIISPDGVARMLSAGVALRADLGKRGLRLEDVTMYSSQAPSAVMSAGVIAASLGIRVAGGTLAEFNPAIELENDIAQGRLPQIGEGFAIRWRDTGSGLTESESFASVYRRSQFRRANLMLMERANEIPIVVTHCGVIEACVNYDTGADCHDMMRGEIAVSEGVERSSFVAFINSHLPR